ncbi:MAG: YchJ family protein [Polyangiaceae bacterium]
MTDNELCPCGSGHAFSACCGPLLEGKQAAPTAEALMRSRYSAFAKGNVDYILSSHDPETVEEVVREEVEVWSRESEWMGLEILRTEAGGPDDDEGVVDFVAKYKLKGLTTQHRERAEFRKLEGKWVFVDGNDIPVEAKAKPAAKWVGGKKNKKNKKK